MLKILNRMLICVFFSGAAMMANAGVDVQTLDNSNWVKVESDNFVVMTDATNQKARMMVAELERFHRFMTPLIGEIQTTADKVPLILAKTPVTYGALGIPRGYAGIFSYTPAGEYSIFANVGGFTRENDGRRNWGRSIVLHEIVHLLIRQSPLGAQVPPWFDEGAAEYFSTYVEDGGNVLLGNVKFAQDRMRSMLRPHSRLEDLDKTVIDTENLFKTPKTALGVTASSTSERQKFLDEFYVRSLAVVHYLNADDGRRQQLVDYFDLILAGYSVNEAFSQAFQMEFSQLDELVEEYIQGEHMVTRVFPIGGRDITPLESLPVVSKLPRRDAMEFLIPKISSLSDALLGEGTRDKMYSALEAIYPDFARN